MFLQMFYEWCAQRAKPKPSLVQVMREESELLHRDTINRELQLIDDQHKIAANRAKARFLLNQIDNPSQPSSESVADIIRHLTP